jgi:hypothetical protein
MEFGLRNRYLFKSYSQFARNCELSAPAPLRYAPTMRTADFNFICRRNSSRSSPPRTGTIRACSFCIARRERTEHRRFPDLLEFLQPGDVLVLNNSRVIPARLHGGK